MIGKIIKGRGFRGVLDYAIKKEKGRLIWTNMASREPRGLAQEFGAIRQLKPRLKNAVFHAALSVPKNEKISDLIWQKIAREYLKRMGFVCSQVVTARHSDTEHDHIHIIANRIGLDGNVVSDSMDFERQEKALRAIEKQFSLQPLVAPRKSAARAPTRDEAAKTERTDEDSHRMLIRGFCEAAVELANSLDEYVLQLKKWGVKTTLFTRDNKRTLKGITYEFDGFKIASGKLGHNFMPAGLAERGFVYVLKKEPELSPELLDYVRDALQNYCNFHDQDKGEMELRWLSWLKRDPQNAGAWCAAWIEGEDVGHIPDANEKEQQISQVLVAPQKDDVNGLDR